MTSLTLGIDGVADDDVALLQETGSGFKARTSVNVPVDEPSGCDDSCDDGGCDDSIRDNVAVVAGSTKEVSAEELALF